MPVQALQCKECDSTYPLDARYVCERCFGPLEVAYDFSGIDPAEAKRKIQAGPQTLWRARIPSGGCDLRASTERNLRRLSSPC